MPRTMSFLMLAVAVLAPVRAAIGQLPPDLEVYLADARLAPGKVFQVTQLSFPFPRQVYERPAGGLHAVAVGPDGRLYFTDANQFDILRTDGLGEERIFRHATYVRDLAFDSRGRLFFSQATGAGGDGTIFRLDLATGRATAFRTVRLEQVGGFWAGHFAFDRADHLYLSSGNRVPAALFAEAGGRFERRYPFNEPITGFAFLDARKLLFTNHRQTLYQLEGFSTRSELLDRSTFTWLNDVAVARTPAGGERALLHQRAPGGGRGPLAVHLGQPLRPGPVLALGGRGHPDRGRRHLLVQWPSAGEVLGSDRHPG